MPANGQIDYIAFDNRVRQIENEITRIGSTVNEHSQALLNPSYLSSIHPSISRVQGESYGRSRSNSVSSTKRKQRSNSDSSQSSDDESPTTKAPKVNNRDKRQKVHNETAHTIEKVDIPSNTSAQDMLADGFEYGRNQKKKEEQKRKNDEKNAAAAARPHTPAIQGQRKRFEFVQGKDDSVSDNFCGVTRPPRVPQVFIFRCDPTRSTEEGVKNHLIARGVKVVEVKQASRPESTFKSFKVSVDKLTDFNLLMSGTCIPKSCRVRKFIPPRNDDNPRFFRGWESSWDAPGSDVAAVAFKENMDQLHRLGSDISNNASGSVSMDTTEETRTESSTVETPATDVQQSDSNTTARTSIHSA